MKTKCNEWSIWAFYHPFNGQGDLVGWWQYRIFFYPIVESVIFFVPYTSTTVHSFTNHPAPSSSSILTSIYELSFCRPNKNRTKWWILITPLKYAPKIKCSLKMKRIVCSWSIKPYKIKKSLKNKGDNCYKQQPKIIVLGLEVMIFWHHTFV